MIHKGDLRVFEKYLRKILVVEYNSCEFAACRAVTIQRLHSDADVLLGIFPKFSEQLFLYKTMDGRFCQNTVEIKKFYTFEMSVPEDLTVKLLKMNNNDDFKFLYQFHTQNQCKILSVKV